MAMAEATVILIASIIIAIPIVAGLLALAKHLSVW